MRTRKKINLKLYDIDGCLYHAIYHKTQNKNDVYIESNTDFFEENIQDINQNQYDEVILGCGSLRQDHHCNQLNAKNDCMVMNQALPLLQSLLSEFVNSLVKIETFLLADIFGFTDREVIDFSAGDAYVNMLLHELGETNLNHPFYVADISKVSLIYAYVHRMANFYPNDDIVIDFYDDHLSILKKIKDFFTQLNEFFLPNNVTLNLNQYAGKGAGKKVFRITGCSSIIDKQYDWTVRYLSSHCYILAPGADLDSKKDYALHKTKELKAYHYDNHYSFSYRNNTMNLWQNGLFYFNLQKFLKMRDVKIPKLESNQAIIAKKSFLTAKQLVEKKLLRNEDAYPSLAVLATFKARLKKENKPT